MTVAVDLVDVLAAALEQAGPEQRARLRAALEVELLAPEVDRAVYTPQTLGEQLGRSPRSIRGAIARGELDAVKRGRGWVIAADAVERWAAVSDRRSDGARVRAPRRRAPGPGPMSRALK